jgi:hypothetical protein
MASVNVPDRMNELNGGTGGSVDPSRGRRSVHIGNPGLTPSSASSLATSVNDPVPAPCAAPTAGGLWPCAHM